MEISLYEVRIIVDFILLWIYRLVQLWNCEIFIVNFAKNDLFIKGIKYRLEFTNNYHVLYGAINLRTIL